MGSIIGIRSGTEEVPYKVIQSQGSFEIRQYFDRIVIETLMHSSDKMTESNGFRTLAAYIFGTNEEHQKIAMTSPVEVRPNEHCSPGQPTPAESLLKGSGMIMRFTLPHDLQEKDVPKPRSHNVNVAKVGAQQFAAVRFSGMWTEEAFQEHSKILLAELQKTQYRAIGPVLSLRYDPPWTISCFRRNEVAVEVMNIGEDSNRQVSVM